MAQGISEQELLQGANRDRGRASEAHPPGGNPDLVRAGIQAGALHCIRNPGQGPAVHRRQPGAARRAQATLRPQGQLMAAQVRQRLGESHHVQNLRFGNPLDGGRAQQHGRCIPRLQPLDRAQAGSVACILPQGCEPGEPACCRQRDGAASIRDDTLRREDGPADCSPQLRPTH